MGFIKRNRQFLYEGFPILILIVCGITLCIRSFYSFSWSDESFYLTVVHRFWLGERVIVDEWNPAQLSMLLLLPFYSLYQGMTGGNEGVYLYFRLLYLAISMFIAFFTYFKLKKRNSHLVSLMCALLYFLYSRANIGGMSYYNVTLSCVLLAVVLVYDWICEIEGNKIQLYIAGIFLAFAVISTPFLVFPYILIGLFLLFKKKYRLFWREILIVIAGTATVAIFCVGYILYRVPMGELLLNIPYILNDPERQYINPLLSVLIILARIIWRFKWTIWISFFLMVYAFYKKKRQVSLSSKELNLFLWTNFMVFIIDVYLARDLLGCINIAGVLFAAPVIYVFSDWKNIDKKVLGIFGTAGISLILGFSLSSNTGLDALTIGFVVLGMGAVLLIFQLDMLKKGKVLYYMALGVFSAVLIQTGILRLFSVYRDAPINQLNTQITTGPAKYLYTTEEHVRQYDELRTAINQYVREDDRVFYSKSCFWSYLCSDNEYGVPSSWRMPFDSPRLQEYYELNPEKIPTCIFVLNPFYGNFESSLIQSNEKVEFPNDNNIEGYLYDYIKQHDYEIIELECATVYRRG